MPSRQDYYCGNCHAKLAVDVLVCQCGNYFPERISSLVRARYVTQLSWEEFCQQFADPDHPLQMRSKFFLDIGDITYRVPLHRKFKVYKNNPQCVTCGVEGTRFLIFTKLIKDGQVAKKDGYGIAQAIFVTHEYRTMSIDHILPQSRGGTDAFANLQTMCTQCNQDKGNDLDPCLLEAC